MDYGTIADGSSHPMSSRYATLEAARASYPFVTALTQEIDWAAIQSAQNTLCAAGGGRLQFPPGTYMMANSGPLVFACSSVIWLGSGFGGLNGAQGTVIQSASATADIIFVTTKGAQTMGWALRDFMIKGPNFKSAAGSTDHGIDVKAGPDGSQIRNFDIAVQINGCGQDGIHLEGPQYPSNSGIIWRGLIHWAKIDYVGRDCFNLTGWVEQMEYESPYCGEAGRDAIHEEWGLMSPNAGLGDGYRNTFRNPSTDSVGLNTSGYAFYLQGAVSTTVENPYWAATGKPKGFAYLEDTRNCKFYGRSNPTAYQGSEYAFLFGSNRALNGIGNWGVEIDLPDLSAGPGATRSFLTVQSGPVSGAVFGHKGSPGNGSTPTPIGVGDWTIIPPGTAYNNRYVLASYS